MNIPGFHCRLSLHPAPRAPQSQLPLANYKSRLRRLTKSMTLGSFERLELITSTTPRLSQKNKNCLEVQSGPHKEQATTMAYSSCHTVNSRNVVADATCDSPNRSKIFISKRGEDPCFNSEISKDFLLGKCYSARSRASFEFIVRTIFYCFSE